MAALAQGKTSYDKGSDGIYKDTADYADDLKKPWSVKKSMLYFGYESAPELMASLNLAKILTPYIKLRYNTLAYNPLTQYSNFQQDSGYIISTARWTQPASSVIISETTNTQNYINSNMMEPYYLRQSFTGIGGLAINIGKFSLGAYNSYTRNITNYREAMTATNIQHGDTYIWNGVPWAVNTYTTAVNNINGMTLAGKAYNFNGNRMITLKNRGDNTSWENIAGASLKVSFVDIFGQWAYKKNLGFSEDYMELKTVSVISNTNFIPYEHETHTFDSYFDDTVIQKGKLSSDNPSQAFMQEAGTHSKWIAGAFITLVSNYEVGGYYAWTEHNPSKKGLREELTEYQVFSAGSQILSGAAVMNSIPATSPVWTNYPGSTVQKDEYVYYYSNYLKTRSYTRIMDREAHAYIKIKIPFPGGEVGIYPKYTLNIKKCTVTNNIRIAEYIELKYSQSPAIDYQLDSLRAYPGSGIDWSQTVHTVAIPIGGKINFKKALTLVASMTPKVEITKSSTETTSQEALVVSEYTERNLGQVTNTWKRDQTAPVYTQTQTSVSYAFSQSGSLGLIFHPTETFDIGTAITVSSSRTVNVTFDITKRFAINKR
ncbi:MAG TPA: hypothetical protein DC049_07120 [Spirochaetia bacterium]|nr:hypothetical protein [Spirochaetia bacterium]